MALYCGVVKIHKCNAEVARNVARTHHMGRRELEDPFKVVFDFPLPKAALEALRRAEATRDDVMHGKPPTEERIRNAIAGVLGYAAELNVELKKAHGFEPFGQLRGFAGRAKKLDERPSRFMLSRLIHSSSRSAATAAS